MPCYYTGSREGDMQLAAEEQSKLVTLLTRLLCEAGNVYNSGGKLKPSQALQSWWKEHAKKDQQRIAREAREAKVATLREKAKAKLTAEECEALGLD